MEIDEDNNNRISNFVEEPHSAVNNLILDYYKKFGKKRDLEQFFSLSTAQSEIKDPTSLFWRRMKSHDDSSDSGGKKSESSTELCRISIKCSIPEPSVSQQHQLKIKSDSDSPPIISEEVNAEPSRHSDNESVKSDDIQSQKSIDGTLDVSTNKPHSPTSSINSQRKLEWDSLADVGYANESDRKNSASSLSTLERMALHQQYSNNDTKDTDLGNPKAQSTPFDVNETKSKIKKEAAKKSTRIYKKDIEFVELNLPYNFDHNIQPINVNLTKHISFNVEKDGVIVENVTKNVSLSPEKVSVETEITPQIKLDKEIQTTLIKKDNSDDASKVKKYPVLISLNTLKRKTRKKKVRKVSRQRSTKKLMTDKENLPLEKSGTEQLSDAESFEYMPGHIYNQNQKESDQHRNNIPGNKSSLESSLGLTTDSSRTTKNSFTKDFERSIDILKTTLNRKNDSDLRKKLIKEIVQKLVDSKYKDDKSSTEFLSGLSFDSKQLDFKNPSCTTTSTSDTNNTANEAKLPKPKKSILRMEKFNSKVLPSTSQSVPNISTASKSEKPILSKILNPVNFSNSNSPGSNKRILDTEVNKASSEELYRRYIEALKREQAYKQHLKDKELFLKQKLANSDVSLNVVKSVDSKAQNRIEELMKDLIRNNYADGSGDASKLEGGQSSNDNFDRYTSTRKQRSHSIFTLSSENSKSSNEQNKVVGSNCNTKTDKHYCCCPFHTTHPKEGVTDSSVQVNINYPKDRESPDRKSKRNSQQPNTTDILNNCEFFLKSSQNTTQFKTDCATNNIKYVCLCTDEAISQEIPENFLIYKCCRLPNKGIKLGATSSKLSSRTSENSSSSISPQQKVSSFISQDCEDKCLVIKDSNSNQTSKSSQTNLNLPLVLQGRSSNRSLTSTSTNVRMNDLVNSSRQQNKISSIYIHEATRCIQTEISIDPKKSDPSLSDINIVNNENCVKLISEQYKQISQPTSLSQENNQFEGNYNLLRTNNISSTETKRSLERESTKGVSTNVDKSILAVEKIDKEIQSFPDPSRNNHLNKVDNKESPNNFTIPIQGTNMTLRVSLGSETTNILWDRKTPKDLKNNTMVSKATETIKSSVNENFTSLSEECTKGVQSSNTNIFVDINQKPRAGICESNKCFEDNLNPELNEEKNNNLLSKPCVVNTCCTESGKYNTYPTKDKLNFQKALLRSNTDPDEIERNSQVTCNQIPSIDISTVQPNNVNAAGKQLSQRVTAENKKDKATSCYSQISSKSTDLKRQSKVSSDEDQRFEIQTANNETDGDQNIPYSKDPLLDIIQDITRRYSKKDIEKSKRKKCFKEIMTVLNYLLDTDETTDNDDKKLSCSSARDDILDKEGNSSKKKSSDSLTIKTLVDKGVQLPTNKTKSHKTRIESSEFPNSSEFPSTSTDSATCKVLNRIKRECEKYHQKRCKYHVNKKCEKSSSTSVNCDQCRRVHHCSCKGHKCKSNKTRTTVEKTKKKCVAYNLIIQTSDSVVSEEIDCGKSRRQLQNIIVKVPSKRKVENVPFKEMATKIEQDLPRCSPRSAGVYRSKSLPNESEVSSTDEFIKKSQAYTVREYLEKNRPDFVEKCSNRQHCLKLINETRPRACDTPRLNMIVVHTPKCSGNSCMETCNICYGGLPFNTCEAVMHPFNSIHCAENEINRIANERVAKRQLLSLQLDRQQTLNALSESELKDFARELGEKLRRKKVAPKFISEQEMKKRSKKIYKSLPEVVNKKEERKKENIKKTNLLMANIFKKNLQQKTLKGSVNISNYSTVIKI